LWSRDPSAARMGMVSGLDQKKAAHVLIASSEADIGPQVNELHGGAQDGLEISERYPAVGLA
jgi:hypothetical protein